MTEQDAVRAANLEFYGAFNASDYPAMETLWARVVPVLAFIRDGRRSSGAEAVMRSWRQHPDQPGADAHHVPRLDQAFLYGEFATVICEEELANGSLVATNLFVKESGAWRMVHHHTGPILARGYDGQPHLPH